MSNYKNPFEIFEKNYNNDKKKQQKNNKPLKAVSLSGVLNSVDKKLTNYD